MSGKSNYFENAVLKLIFNNVAIAGIANASTPSTLWVALHTANPSDDGDQTFAEATYSSYARVGVPRTTAGWTVTNGIVRPTSAIEFPESSGGASTITHFSVGTNQTGAGQILYYGEINPVTAITSGIKPVLGNNSTISEE